MQMIILFSFVIVVSTSIMFYLMLYVEVIHGPFRLTSLTSNIFIDIEVPTMDNVRSAMLIGYLLVNETNVLCVGPTGSSKTLTISTKLLRGMPKKYICDFMTFSARTTASQTQVL